MVSLLLCLLNNQIFAGLVSFSIVHPTNCPGVCVLFPLRFSVAVCVFCRRDATRLVCCGFPCVFFAVRVHWSFRSVLIISTMNAPSELFRGGFFPACRFGIPVSLSCVSVRFFHSMPLSFSNFISLATHPLSYLFPKFARIAVRSV